MRFEIRRAIKKDYKLLDDFIHEAIYVPKGFETPPKSIINQPDLQVYVADFGKQEDDYCLLAEVDGLVVGAAWVRIMNDYGHIDNETPSLAISVFKDYRGYGIGTALMERLLSSLKEKGYKKTSLAVQKANYAFKLYLKVGYDIIAENDEEYIMVRYL